ncbi:MAG TPA: CapA family protein, partial [Chloroflexia bacterium]|nr:CapA family protein [Chloroflexia bacterium]
APIIKLLFTGDINPGRCPAEISIAHNDFTRPFLYVAEALREADITIGSLDGSLSDISPPSPCPTTMNLVGPTRMAEGYVYAGIDLITVATNHAKDCGKQGWQCNDRTFNDTLKTLKAAGIAAAGGGENLAAAFKAVVIEKQGVRFAFVGVTEVGDNTWAEADRPGTAPLSEANLPLVLEAIRAARQEADVVIVLPQWGEEYHTSPSANQWRWAPQMIEAGADLVIGNQAHVVQPVEIFPAAGGSGPRVVAYALGNFVFDQGPYINKQGVVFEATFEGARLAEWRLRPLHIYGLHQPQWARESEAQEILDRVQAASEALPER